MGSFWNKSVHTLRFNFKSAVLLLFLWEGETWVVGAESLRGVVFLGSVYNASASSRAALIFSGQHAAYPDQFLY